MQYRYCYSTVQVSEYKSTITAPQASIELVSLHWFCTTFPGEFSCIKALVVSILNIVQYVVLIRGYHQVEVKSYMSLDNNGKK